MTPTDALADALAATLYSEVRDAGWSLAKLSEELDVSEQTLQRYLTRRSRSMPTWVLTRTCHLIGVPLSDVVAGAYRRLEREASGGRKSDVG